MSHQSSLKNSNLTDLLFHNVHMGVAVFDNELKLVRFNETWHQLANRYLAGCREALQIGADFEDVFFEETNRLKGYFNRALGGETQQIKGLKVACKTDFGYWDCMISPIYNGAQAIGVLQVVTDATERITAELALQENNQNLHAFLQSAQTFALFRVQPDPEQGLQGVPKLVMITPSIVPLTGAKPTDALANWVENVHPEDRAEIRRLTQSCFESRSEFTHTFRLFHPKKNAYIWIQVIANPVIDPAGAIEYYNGILVDVTQQKHAEMLTKDLEAFRNLLITLSTEFINLPSEKVDAGILTALQKIGEFSGIDRSYVFLYEAENEMMSCKYEWCREGIQPELPNLQKIPLDSFAWSNSILRAGKEFHIPSIQDLPQHAELEKREFLRQDIKSLLVVPMMHSGDVIGFLGFDSVRTAKTWSDETISVLKIASEIIVNALEDKRAQSIQAGQRQILELLAAGWDINETLSALIHIVEDQFGEMLGLILLLDEDGETLHIGAAGRLPKEYTDSIEGLKIGPLVGSCGTACFTRRRVIVEDIDTDPRWDGLRSLAQHYHLRACWSEPVISVNGKVIGTFAMYYRFPRKPNEYELRIIEMGAHLVGVALEQKRSREALQEAYQTLENRVEERTHELERRRKAAEGLHGILAMLNSNETIENVLTFIVTQSRAIMEADACMIRSADKNGYIHTVAHSGVPDVMLDDFYYPMKPDTGPASLGSRLSHGELVLEKSTEPGLRKITPPPTNQQEQILRRVESYYPTNLVAPIIVKGSLFGSMRFMYTRQRDFSDEYTRLAKTLADQVALAMENSRLRAQAEETAVITERNRLARDLHDAVTQTLFSSSLIADVLPRIWEYDMDEAMRRLEELRQLTRGALAEMRSLLLELRPSALEEADLRDLVRHLSNAFTGRTRTPVDVKISGDLNLPPDVKLVFYRITQEVLNNIAKHAAASNVIIALDSSAGNITLTIVDDGVGFDPTTFIGAEHLGLRIMRERCENINATIQIESKPDAGTKVTAVWSQEQANGNK